METKRKKCVGYDDRRRKDLAMIHIARKQLKMDEPAYRQMLTEVAGVRSAAELGQDDRRKVLAHLKDSGFKSFHKSASRSGMHVTPSEDRAPYIAKIGYLLTDMQLSWAYADGMARKMFGVDFVRWLKPGQLQKIMVALIYHKKRKKA